MHYIRISSDFDLRLFIHDLRLALKHSKQNGGGYSAFLHLRAGEKPVLQIEIALKVEQ